MIILSWSTENVILSFKLNADLNYVEDSAGGPDVTVGILPKLDKVTLLQVSSNAPFLSFLVLEIVIITSNYEHRPL